MLLFVFLIGFYALLLLSTPVHAVELKNMGAISVVVPNESDEERFKGTYLGLSQVLVRLSGNKDVLKTEIAQELLKGSSRYLLQYSYDTIDSHKNSKSLVDDYSNSTSEFNSALGEQSKDKLLSLKFDQLLLVKKLQAGGAAVWDANRPEVMFWWVSEENGSRNMVSDGENSRSRDALIYFAEQRAVPIKLPVMDLEDQKRVTTSDVWGAYNEQLAKASKRYNLNTWVSGKNYYASGSWHASWEVHVLGDVRAFKSQSPSLFVLQKAVIASVARVLASEYAVKAGENGSTLLVSVNQVRSLDSFSEIQSYLESLFVIESLDMYELQSDRVTFKIILKEDLDKFKKILAVDRKLFEEATIESAEGSSISKDSKIVSDLPIDTSTSALSPGEEGSSQSMVSESAPSILNLLEKSEPEPVLPHVLYRWYQN